MNLGHLNFPSAIGFCAVFPPMCFLPENDYARFGNNAQGKIFQTFWVTA